MNFDTVPSDVRLPADLPKRLSVKVDNSSNADIHKKYNFSNCRTILPELLNGKVHVGMTNVIRNNDGIIRKVAPIMVYQDKYYPYLTFAAGSNYLAASEVKNF